MARVNGPGKGMIIIYNTDKGFFSMTACEPIEISSSALDDILAGTHDIQIKPVREDGHLRFEFDAVVSHS